MTDPNENNLGIPDFLLKDFEGYLINGLDPTLSRTAPAAMGVGFYLPVEVGREVDVYLTLRKCYKHVGYDIKLEINDQTVVLIKLNRDSSLELGLPKGLVAGEITESE